MKNSVILLLIVTLNCLGGCAILKTFDNVELMIGIKIPLYTRNIDIGMTLILKDQAINKIQEAHKGTMVKAYAAILRSKNKTGG